MSRWPASSPGRPDDVTLCQLTLTTVDTADVQNTFTLNVWVDPPMVMFLSSVEEHQLPRLELERADDTATAGINATPFNPNWTNSGRFTCSAQLPIYCVQQPEQALR